MLPTAEPLKLFALPTKDSSLRSRVEATRPPTSTWAPLPNTMPSGLMRYTWPLAFKCPRIWLPPAPTMRFTATALADGCTKVTVSSGAMSKLCQLTARFWVD